MRVVALLLLLAPLLAVSSMLIADDDDKCHQASPLPVHEFTICKEFAERYWNKQPAVYRATRQHLAHYDQFTAQTSLASLAALSDLQIRLSTSVSYTGRVFTQTSVADYVQGVNNTITGDDDAGAPPLPANETFYLFGNHNGAAWDAFLASYPKLEQLDLFSCVRELHHRMGGDGSALSFGCAGRHTGVPWHFHGPGFLHQLWGQKQWFLVPFNVSNEKIQFDPNGTTWDWWNEHQKTRRQRPSLPQLQTATLQEGDVIYFPPMWKHATLNLSPYTAWISTFL